MAEFRTEDLRTVALVGHGAAGKTTLAEQLLAKAGMIGAAGSVERGTTVSDYDPQEKSTLHSLRSSVLHCDYKGARIHLIDTPGYPDFIGQAIGALDAVETVAVVVSATNGIELVTRRMMAWAKARNLCRMIVVNKIDHEHIDLPLLLEQLQEAFGPEVLPINLPADNGARVIDCFDHDEGAADFLSVTDVHRRVMEQVVEVDDAAMEKYLEEGAVDPTTLHGPLEKALREGHLIPVCFVSARTGAGVQDLLDVMVRHLPNPTEGNPPLFFKGEGEGAESFRSDPDPGKHVLAHVFKVVNDPYVGKIGIFRVHQGTIGKDTQLFVGEGSKPFKVGHLFMLQGKATSRCRDGAGRHRRGGQGRRHRVRRRAARLPRRGPDPDEAARLPEADVRPGHRAAPPRRRGADLGDPHQDVGRGSDAARRPRHRDQRDRAARTDRTAPAQRARTDEFAVQARGRHRGRRASPTARPSPRRPRATTGTRSRPAAPGSSARSTCASSRCRAAAASSSSTRSRAA